jgi:hypothetical protein
MIITTTAMNTIITQAVIESEDGDSKYPSSITLKMDGSKMSCPVTFWAKGKPVFSLASEEIPAFCRALSAMDANAQ